MSNVELSLLERYPVLRTIVEDLESARELVLSTARNSNKFLVAGNGGSSADADHIVGELMKSFVLKRPISPDVASRLEQIDSEKGAYIAERLQGAIFAICLSSHQALVTAFMNDVDPSLVFAQQVYGFGGEGDLFWGLSTSGNSLNVIQAAIVAKAKGMHVLGMTGASGGRMKQYCDVCVCVPELETYKVQEFHLPIYHWLCLELEASLWPSKED